MMLNLVLVMKAWHMNLVLWVCLCKLSFIITGGGAHGPMPQFWQCKFSLVQAWRNQLYHGQWCMFAFAPMWEIWMPHLSEVPSYLRVFITSFQWIPSTQPIKEANSALTSQGLLLIYIYPLFLSLSQCYGRSGKSFISFPLRFLFVLLRYPSPFLFSLSLLFYLYFFSAIPLF